MIHFDTDRDHGGQDMAARAALTEAVLSLTDALRPGTDELAHVRGLAALCVAHTGADAVGVLLVDTDGTPRVLGAPPGSEHLAALFDRQAESGPALLACTGGEPVADAGWAADAGFARAHAVPLRLRDDVRGAVCLYREADEPFSADDLAAARALADAAAIGLHTAAVVRRAAELAGQLQSALDSRVVIEQAKGVLAERDGLDMPGAFQRLRALARGHNLRIGRVAEEVVRSVLDRRERAATGS